MAWKYGGIQMNFRNSTTGAMSVALLFFLHSAFPQAPALVPAPASPLYVVTYVEARSTSTGEAAKLLRSYRDASRAAPGNMRSIVVQRIDRPGQFVMLTTWHDTAAWDFHGAAASTREFRDKLAALRVAPIDDRLHGAFSVGPLDDPGIAGALYSVTHVDVIPQGRNDAETELKLLAEANRKANGNLRYEVVQQTSRPNHFTVFEVWRSRAAFDANVLAAPQREFRDKLGSMAGALYDERLYALLD
jgi:quinol monooxygenase YgiN